MKPRQPRKRQRQMSRQLVDNAFAPFGGFELFADVFAHLPVQTDEFRIDRLIGAGTGLPDKTNDFREGGLER